MGNRRFLDMNGYQWTVLFAAWLGWGFDVFDSLLFNYVAPNCVPTLLGIPLGTPEAKHATLLWVGILTSLLLIGWGIGGIVFGKVCDRIGRTKTLLLTMILYAVGTALCSVAPNIWVLALCRLIASFGIGGEWAAGAAMVAEVVPEKRRVEAGAILYSSAPMGLFLAAFATKYVEGHLFAGQPEVGWRYVFLCGLLPALVAFIIRLFIKEPERWESATDRANPARIKELFTPEFRRTTLSGLGMAVVALLTWWSCNAFIPTVGAALAGVEAKAQGLDKRATEALVGAWKVLGSNWFNLGGLIGTLLTIPVAKYIGRKVMYGGYFLASGIAIMTTFGLNVPGETRLFLCFFIGLTVFGVFGSFTYYLPELYPTRLRATGAGFCYNAGRFIAAGGPPIVGMVASMGADTLATAMRILFWVGLVPLAGLLLLPLVVETKGKVLAD
ncbi:MAG: MFS transporter [Fimbriimonadaceae bacterium]